MFHAKFASIKDFKHVIEATRDLIEVANFKLGKNGLSFQAVDNSRTALVALQIGPKGFEQLQADEEIFLGMKFINLYKVFKCIESDNSLIIENSEEDKFVKMFFSDAVDMKLARFNLSLMNKVEDELNIPEFGFESKVVVASEEFARIIRDLNQISEEVQITVTKQFMSLSVKSEMIEGTITYKNSHSVKDDKFVKLNVTSEFSNVFSLKFLTEFCRAAPLSDVVVLYFSKETPLTIEFPIQKYGSLRYYLAPKLTE